MDDCSPAKRFRKPNWVPDEVRTLLQELQIESKSLFGANTASNTMKMKAMVWRRIAKDVSALGIAQRTADEVKLKWKGLKKEVIEKDAEVGKTCGGQAKERHLPYEKMVRAVLGEKTAQFHGINVDGCETTTMLDVGNDQQQRQIPCRGYSVLNVTGPHQEVPGAIDVKPINLPLTADTMMNVTGPHQEVPGAIDVKPINLPLTADTNAPSASRVSPLPSSQIERLTDVPSTSGDSPSPYSQTEQVQIKSETPDDPSEQDFGLSPASGQKEQDRLTPGATPAWDQTLKVRLWAKRKQTGSSSTGRQVVQHESEEDCLFKEYLRAEIKKSNAVLDMMKERERRDRGRETREKEKHEMEKKKYVRQAEESKARTRFYEMMFKKLSEQNGNKQNEEGNMENVKSWFIGEETFV